MTETRRFPLHWVFKIGSLDETIRFYETVFGMKVHRHEEFDSGCEATCNGPYGGAWSKTMVGWGKETTNFALELTYNYGIESYEQGNDFRYIAVAARDYVERGLKNGYNVTELPGGYGYKMATAPDGYRYLLVPGTTGTTETEPFLFVSIHVSDLAASLKYYTEVLGFKQFKNVPGALNNEHSAVIGFHNDYCKLELVELPKGVSIDHKKAIGRMAIETEDGAPNTVADDVKSAKGKIVHGPLKLPPHDEHLVIVGDADGYEYCYVAMTGYRCGSLSVKNNEIDWEKRKKILKGGKESKSDKSNTSTTSPIQSADDFKKVINTPDKLVIVKFFANWCNPCKKIKPAFEKAAEDNKDKAIFKTLDIDEFSEVAQSESVPSVPTFKFYKNGKEIDYISSSDETTLRSAITKHLTQ
jgi:thioredoxin/lactoylglutathione lyase